MKASSYHFIFAPGTRYSDLKTVFPDILKIILAENDHFQTAEEEEQREMFIQLNMADLEMDRKPEGYNRKGKYRLIFPLDRMEFYIRSFNAKPKEIKDVSEKVSEMLSTANVKYEMVENDDIGLD